MTRWSEKDFAEFQSRKREAPFAVPDRPDIPKHAKAILPTRKMNKTEAAYAQHLELQRHAGEICWYEFEPLKLRLADNTFYTPDFGVVAKDGVFELRETKGFMRDDAAVKIKVAAAKFPFRFWLVRKTKTGWKEEQF